MGTSDWDAVCADAGKTPPKRARGVSRKQLPTPGPLLPEAHESLISSKTIAAVPLTGLSFFVLRFDFKLTPGANNGLAIRAPGKGSPAFDGIELQILDDGHEKYKDLQPWQAHGSIYGVVASERGTCLKPAGQWNTEEVTVRGTKIKEVVNGKTILDADTAPFRDGQATPDGKPHPGLNRPRGHIGFAGHLDEVHFRNIRVKRLEP